MKPIEPRYELGHREPPEAMLTWRALQDGATHHVKFTWSKPAPQFVRAAEGLDGASVLCSGRFRDWVGIGFTWRGSFIWVGGSETGLEGWALGRSQRDTEETVEALKEVLAPGLDDPDEVLVRFWLHDHTSFKNFFERQLVVPRWADIRDNYPAETKEVLDRLMVSPLDTRLMLWRGSPGGGKTFAVRALAREWSRSIRIEYISDADVFFAEPPYMMEVLLDQDNAGESERRVLILEDAGQFVRSDHGLGQGLSRLLNIVDGIIGQGLQLTLLVTTNEDISHLHPAVTRPGRCADIVEFGPLSPVEADEWLRHRGAEGLAEGASTFLADLYALLEGRASRKIEPAAGYV